jgi:hypothetical protein
MMHVSIATGRWARAVGFSRFKNKPKNCFPCEKIDRKMRKILGNFVEVGNPIYNTFSLLQLLPNLHGFESI